MRQVAFIVLFFSQIFSNQLILEKQLGNFQKPIYLTASSKQSDTLFVVEQFGSIKTIIRGKREIDLLDIRDRVHQPHMPGDERGLLCMALHPDFNNNGKFYVNYVNKDDITIISSFQLIKNKLKANSNNEEIILSIKQPYANHNGGQLAFDKNGYLYVGVGDGGYAGDPKLHSQNNQTLFGTILRIDVNSKKPYIIPEGNPYYFTKDLRTEIYCYGLRNPWRFSFDKQNGDLYIADVGQNNWEEVNYITMDEASGSNFGWNMKEGSYCYNPKTDCPSENLIDPVFEYPNNANYIKTLIGWDQHNVKGCSITGGYVYRGGENPEVYGEYFFGDYCTGNVWSFKIRNNKAVNYKEWDLAGIDEDFYLSSFGEDGLGELYLINHKGSIYKIADIK